MMESAYAQVVAMDTNIGRWSSVEKTQKEKYFLAAWDRLLKRLSDQGGHFERDWKRAILRLASKHPDMIVRRDRPRAILDSMEGGLPIAVRRDPAQHGDKMYPNAGVIGSGAEGMRIPYQRGFGGVDDEDRTGPKGKSISIVGFLPGPDLRIERLGQDEYPHYRNQPERSMIRMIEGEVPLDNLRFLLLRFPKVQIPEDFLTDDELDDDELLFANRVFLFNEKD